LQVTGGILERCEFTQVARSPDRAPNVLVEPVETKVIAGKNGNAKHATGLQQPEYDVSDQTTASLNVPPEIRGLVTHPI
jgi:hypothetical protein